MSWKKAAAEENLRQLLNHVICLLKAHFASLCVTWAWRMRIEWAKSDGKRRGSRCRKCRKNFWYDSRCVCVSIEPGKKEKPPSAHRFYKLFNIKKKERRQIGSKIKQTQAEKKHHEKSSKHQHRNQERKFCFLNTNFAPIDSLICYLPFTVYFSFCSASEAFFREESHRSRQSNPSPMWSRRGCAHINCNPWVFIKNRLIPSHCRAWTSWCGRKTEVFFLMKNVKSTNRIFP